MVNRLVLVVSILLPCSGRCQDDDLAGASRPEPAMSLNRRRQYKRVHQLALRYLLLDRGSEARSFVDDFLSGAPDDAESAFVLGLLDIDSGNTDAAVAQFDQALERGLPPGRLIAGPRELLAPVADQPLLLQAIESFADKPVHGPLIGHTTDQSASFWFRTARESTMHVVVRRPGDDTRVVARGRARSTAASDFTCVVTVQGLQPNTEYAYAVQVDDSGLQANRGQRFRTFPTPGHAAKFRIAFGGGAGYVPANERMWETIRERKPDAMLLLGDNVYIDDPESPEMQRYTYYRRQSRPEWRALTARTPVYAIWDDHDFSTNDSWGGPMIEKPFWKKEYSYDIFRQNWANPAFGGGDDQPGCWHAFSIGDVDFIMLDCRFYRTDPEGEAPSMLGPVQMDWFKRQLLEAKGAFKVLCSSVPWDFRTKGGSKDTWNGYQEERAEIFRFLAENAIEGVVLMSADRHRSDAWRIERPDAYDLYEFNSSRLTNQHVHQTMEEQGAIFSYNAKQSFGLVSFDTMKAEPEVAYEVITIDNESVESVRVPLSRLRHR